MGTVSQEKIPQGQEDFSLNEVHLTDQERHLLRLYVQQDASFGSTAVAAASALGISIQTARARLAKLLSKLSGQVNLHTVPLESQAGSAGPAVTPLDEIPILKAIEQVVPDHEEWLDTPNVRFMGRKPSELLAEGDEEPIREILRSAVYIGVS